MNEPIRVLALDDAPIYCAGIRHALEAAPGFALALATGDPAHAFAQVRVIKPHVILLGLNRATHEPIRLARALSDYAPVLALAERAEDEAELNVAGFSRKTIDAPGLRDALQRVARGERAGANETRALSPRQAQVLKCAASGESNKLIARTLSIREKTVKNHMTLILRKLGMTNRTQAVMCALQRGWVAL
ncbi:MAG: response regulator transcription factor [Chloroflexi bacterium]|nr:response regulator transcription factor [Chloroflexota bacterium]